MRALNWWAIISLSFCVLCWGAGVTTVAKTTNIYVHRTNAGFRHDFLLHAKVKLSQVKHLLTPA